jgi:hypothetical protein
VEKRFLPIARATRCDFMQPCALQLLHFLASASCTRCCNKIADAQAAVSVNEKKWLVMHMHVQLDELHQVCLPFLAILHAVAGTLL